MLIIAAAVIGFYFVMPEVVKRGYEGRAAREGLTLSIDQVELSRQSVRLLGVTLSAPDVPGTIHARAVEVTLEKLDPVEVAVHDAQVTIDASYGSLYDALTRWSNAHVAADDGRGTLRRATVDAANVAWTRPFGEATRIDVENATMTVEREEAHTLGDDLEVTAPLVTVTTSAAGKMGFWKASWRKQLSGSRLSLVLDPVSGARATVIVAGGNVVSVDLTVPREPLAQLGLAPTAFGRRAEDPFLLEAALKYARSSSSQATGELHVDVLGARLSGAPSSVEAGANLRIEGDPNAPMDLKDGSFALGPFRGKLAGTVTMMPQYLKADLSWKTASLRCNSADPSQMAVASMTGAIHFDSRGLDDTALVLVPSAKCGLKIFPP